MKYKNINEIATSNVVFIINNVICIIAALVTRPVQTNAVSPNREVRMCEIDACGFDYDYTLVNY